MLEAAERLARCAKQAAVGNQRLAAIVCTSEDPEPVAHAGAPHGLAAAHLTLAKEPVLGFALGFARMGDDLPLDRSGRLFGQAQRTDAEPAVDKRAP